MSTNWREPKYFRASWAHDNHLDDDFGLHDHTHTNNDDIVIKLKAKIQHFAYGLCNDSKPWQSSAVAITIPPFFFLRMNVNIYIGKKKKSRFFFLPLKCHKNVDVIPDTKVLQSTLSSRSKNNQSDKINENIFVLWWKSLLLYLQWMISILHFIFLLQISVFVVIIFFFTLHQTYFICLEPIECRYWAKNKRKQQ